MRLMMGAGVKPLMKWSDALKSSLGLGHRLGLEEGNVTWCGPPGGTGSHRSPGGGPLPSASPSPRAPATPSYLDDISRVYEQRAGSLPIVLRPLEGFVRHGRSENGRHIIIRYLSLPLEVRQVSCRLGRQT